MKLSLRGNATFRMNVSKIDRKGSNRYRQRTRETPSPSYQGDATDNTPDTASITDNWQTPLSYKNVLLRFLCELFLLLFSIISTPSSTHSVFMPTLSPNTPHSSGIHFFNHLFNLINRLTIKMINLTFNYIDFTI